MGEIKSVKVDNWGVFFLQKLQNFFNKTDYCDLTLQFRDNSQLKVHRLVLSACTDYFNVLEHTCEVVDDALIMPNELQADVVVPIVNFMYTGTLEFELKMYGKLLRTAKEMNMTVLLKLLEAHRRTMEGVSRAQRPPSPKTIRRGRAPQTIASPSSQQQQRRILTTSNVAVVPIPQQQPQRRIVQTKTIATNASAQPQVQYRQQIGSTSVLKTSAAAAAASTGSSHVKVQYGGNVYETQHQFKNEPEDYETSSQHIKQQPSSPFEQLRKGYNNNKRPATAAFISPPAKKPNIEDVKEFAEQQRMRKQIAAEYGEDTEYEGMLDDDIHNDDDDDDTAMASSSSAATLTMRQQQQQQHQQQIQPGTTTITFKQEQGDKPPTIVVKDSSNSKMNHAKIISEVLRQYPHLVKGNKNIKLKIMPNVGGQTQKIIVKKETSDSAEAQATPVTSNIVQQQQQKLAQKPLVTSQTLLKPFDKTTTSQQALPTAAKAQVQKAVATTPHVGLAAANPIATTPSQKRRIDSKTMHALIALGAENTTGPWLCLRCGVNGRPISIPSYRGFRRHLINTHKESIDPALCEHCGLRSNNNRELHFHMQMEHKVKTTLYTFPECLMCTELFLDTNGLNQHMLESHPDENKQQCIYCNKIFARELQLYTHMKSFHKKQALDDGIIDYSDEEFVGSQDESELEAISQTVPSAQSVMRKDNDTKIKILSDISLPSTSPLVKLEPTVENSTLSASVVSTLSTDNASEDHVNVTTASEPKFVNAEGNEMQLTDEQRKEIMSQLNQEHGGGVVMLLNENTFAAETAGGESNISAGDIEESMQSEESAAVAAHGTESDNIDSATAPAAGSAVEEEFDDSEIYSELLTHSTQNEEPHTKKLAGSALEESKGSNENLEWAENLISAHEMAEETTNVDKTAEEKAKKDDDISKKLKELTGDWSDDENDEDEPMEQEEEASSTIADLNNDAVPEVPSDTVEKTKEVEAPTPKEKEIEKEHVDDEENVENPPGGDEESQIDEDDIEMAMKSLHKEDIIEQEDAKEEEIPTTQDLDDTSDEAKANVKHENIKKVKSEKSADDTSEKSLKDDEEEFLSITASEKLEEKIEDKTEEINTENTDVQKVAEEFPELETDDGIKIEKEVEKNLEIKTEKSADQVKVEEIKESNTEAVIPATDESVEVDGAHVSDIDNKILCSDAAETVKNLTTDANANATNTINTTNTETETATTTKSAADTEEKVKNLRSDWGDDDDDDADHEEQL